MKEFTGERVIPGEVDTDLWNEHMARYAFAARLSSWKRILEIACGTGYGTAYIAPEARFIVGLDVSTTATEYAASHFEDSNLRYLTASATALPFRDRTFDLVIAFEVIEHLSDWPRLLSEAQRVLAPGGQLILSTPNKEYYAESRKHSGPNPYHCHEFTFEEFRDALQATFPHVSIFLQNHADGLVFHPLHSSSATSVQVESSPVDPTTANFFLAVCASVQQMGSPTFVYLPTAGNVLREREHHIERLEGELSLKDDWLNRLKAEQEKMVELFREQKQALEASNHWSQNLKMELQATLESRDTLHHLLNQKEIELTTAHQTGLEMAAGYEQVIAELTVDKARWAADTANQVAAKNAELQRCLELLRQSEQTVDERTIWAQTLDSEISTLRDELARIHESRWIRLGRTLRLGPGARRK